MVQSPDHSWPWMKGIKFLYEKGRSPGWPVTQLWLHILPATHPNPGKQPTLSLAPRGSTFVLSGHLAFFFGGRGMPVYLPAWPSAFPGSGPGRSPWQTPKLYSPLVSVPLLSGSLERGINLPHNHRKQAAHLIPHTLEPVTLRSPEFKP